MTVPALHLEHPIVAPPFGSRLVGLGEEWLTHPNRRPRVSTNLVQNWFETSQNYVGQNCDRPNYEFVRPNFGPDFGMPTWKMGRMQQLGHPLICHLHIGLPLMGQMVLGHSKGLQS